MARRTNIPAIVKNFGVHLGIQADSWTAAANITLTVADANIQKIDPDGARDLPLPAESAEAAWFLIINAAGGAETITVKNAAGSTLDTVDQNEAGLFCNIAGVWTFMCVWTIALT